MYNVARIPHAEWLINRALADGDTRKMRRALNASLKIRQRQHEYEHATAIRKQLAKLMRNMRKFRKWKAENHPTDNISVKISVTE